MISLWLEGPKLTVLIRVLILTFRMNLRNRNRTTGSENPDLRDTIASEVGETLQQLLPGLFAQMKDDLSVMIDQKIEAAFTARDQRAGGCGQGQNWNISYKDFSACQSPLFEGKKDPVTSTRWIAEVEGAFRTSFCPPEAKVRFATNLLRGSGKDWWGLIVRSRTEAEIEAMTWDGFKELFREQYVPQIEVERITGEFLNLVQTTESVNEITDKFLEKSLFCPEYVANEKMKMYRYMNVLRADIREFVTTARCQDLNQMMEVARAWELYLEETQAKKRKHEQPQAPMKKQKYSGHRPEIRKDYPRCAKCGRNHPGECRAGAGVCYKCGKPGHMSRDCRETPKLCFHCYQPGHYKS
jgi:hypothetical protein